MDPNLCFHGDLIWLRADPASGGFNPSLHLVWVGFLSTANAKRRLNILKGSGQVEDSERLPLFCCATPPQGWSFHTMGNLTKSLSVWLSILRKNSLGVMV